MRSDPIVTVCDYCAREIRLGDYNKSPACPCCGRTAHPVKAVVDGLRQLELTPRGAAFLEGMCGPWTNTRGAK